MEHGLPARDDHFEELMNLDYLNKQNIKIVRLISMQLSARMTADRLSFKSFSLSFLRHTFDLNINLLLRHLIYIFHVYLN